MVYARAYRKLYATDGAGRTNGWPVVIIHNDMYISKQRNINTTKDLNKQRNVHSPGVTTLRCFASIVTRIRVGRAGVRVPKGVRYKNIRSIQNIRDRNSLQLKNYYSLCSNKSIFKQPCFSKMICSGGTTIY